MTAPITSALVACHNVAYHSIIADASPCGPAAFRALVAAAQPLDLQHQVRYATVYSRDAQHVAAVAAELGITHAADGTIITEPVMSTPDFESTGTGTSATNVCANIDGLLALPLPAQNKCPLLTVSLQRRMLDLMRVLAWDLISVLCVRPERGIGCS